MAPSNRDELSSDSENYDIRADGDGEAPHHMTESSEGSVVPYQQSSSWNILRRCLINLFLPFVNGLMLGFGELFAHEAAYRIGWSNTKIFPVHRRTAVSSQKSEEERRREESSATAGFRSIQAAPSL
ncbi:Outer membrane protein, MIM1/TOM13, mitochondrial [Ascosphaera apis ARSEF 7405]|uniref:Outer membrane protein, MIM1/TOM13, mitochondrial n=1 Tax=Ascosphaera apis ARSEF 7405 TaxID=392613 RepID=A0A167V5M8_9EURO|nr:Outer membrane protein, MIM1/TOM13, mitochondrial [Ascosphaera apis ARSEF 7405]